MTLWFQSILAIALVLLCVFLFLLLRQLQRTAVAVEDFAKSAKDDLKRVAEDIHDLRNRAEKLLDLAADNLELPLNIKGIISKSVQTMDMFLTHKNATWLELIFTNMKLIYRLIHTTQRNGKL